MEEMLTITEERKYSTVVLEVHEWSDGRLHALIIDNDCDGCSASILMSKEQARELGQLLMRWSSQQ